MSEEFLELDCHAAAKLQRCRLPGGSRKGWMPGAGVLVPIKTLWWGQISLCSTYRERLRCGLAPLMVSL